jgi:hypothetical protein
MNRLLTISTFLKTIMEYEFANEIWCECKPYLYLRMEFLLEFVEGKITC